MRARKPKIMHQPPPIAGFTPVSQANVFHVNKNKHLEELVLRRIEDMAKIVEGVDPRWVAIAKTHIQQGFGALNRAILQPQRISGELDYGPTEKGSAEDLDYYVGGKT